KDVGLVEELRDHLDDIARQRDILRFLGVDAEPGVVANAELRGPLGFNLSEMSEVVAEAFSRAAIEARPARQLRNRQAAALRHALVVVGDAGDHVNMRIDVVHERLPVGWRSTSPIISRSRKELNRPALEN